MPVKDKKYYWLKLKENFFKRHDIKIIESQKNGEKYVLFYLKLLAESISYEGELRFSDLIPYNEEMLSTITSTDIDVVRSAIKVLTELKMVEILEDGTIYMTEVKKMLGHETYWAKQKRQKRLEKDVQNNQLSLKTQEELTVQDSQIEEDQDVIEIFDYWNSKEIVKHKKLTLDMKRAIEKRIKQYSVFEVKSFIDRYKRILDDKDYFFNYSWDLLKFMKQKNTLPEFTDEGSKWVDYIRKFGSNKKQEPSFMDLEDY